MKDNKWLRLLTYVTGLVNQELLLQNEYLAAENFFTVEVLTWQGLVTYYVLFFIHLESRRVSLAGITRHPDEAWMQQMARNATGRKLGTSGAEALRTA